MLTGARRIANLDVALVAASFAPLLQAVFLYWKRIHQPSMPPRSTRSKPS
ncbi:hypothetical protein AIOL_002079 [Candidatus Rhodobacter oscarellae]|uniref:Uncharacterized protein n=1 Tax=Candidatus Rhodobacter oscarellae TaxID=1675527 RepID=A0A0J9E316_9RHOB|nr:hypothetical protein AIOL_002079 [Candidatus Rhodobacter lobularis]